MVYLIYVNHFDKEENELLELLKIGYTADNRKEIRYQSYKLHYPPFKVLYEIPYANTLDEKRLQKYFQEFKYSDYGLEWFKYDQSIIDYFNTHTTKDSLSDLGEICTTDRSKLWKFRNYVRDVATNIVNYKITQGEVILGEAERQIEIIVSDVNDYKRIRAKVKLFNYLKDTYHVTEDILNYGEEIDDPDILDFIRKFESKSLFPEKMKLLCECNLSEDTIKVILDLLPIVFKNYYVTLGKTRIKSLNYRKNFLDKECSRLKGNQENSGKLKDLIYDKVEVGKKYTKQYLKELLAQIYVEAGIKEAPKSTALEEYFELKKIQTTNKETGKRDNGFLIVGIKS